MSNPHGARRSVPKSPAGGRLAYKASEVCELLGCSRDFFDEHVKHELRVVRRGRLRLIPAAELHRWLDDNAETVLS